MMNHQRLKKFKKIEFERSNKRARDFSFYKIPSFDFGFDYFGLDKNKSDLSRMYNEYFEEWKNIYVK